MYVAESTDKLWTKNFILILLSNVGVSCSNFFLLAVLPILVQRTSGSAIWAGTITGVFTFASLASRPFSGALVNKIGRIKLAKIAVVICAACCPLYGTATVVLTLVAYRVIHGFALGLQTTAISTAAVDVIPFSRRKEGIGYLGILGIILYAIVPGIAISLMKGNNDKFMLIAFLAGGLALMSFAVQMFIKYENHPEHKKEVYPVTNEKPATAIGLEAKAFKPAFLLFVISFAHSCNISFLPLFALSKGYENIGLFFTLSAVSALAFRLFLSKIGYNGTREILILALVLSAVTFFLIPVAGSGIFVILLGLPYGVTQAIIAPTFNAIIINKASRGNHGAANSTYYAALDLGVALGSIIWGLVASASNSQYGVIFFVASGLCVVSGMVYFIYIKFAGETW